MAVRVWCDTQLQPPLQNLGTLFIKPARQIEQQVSLAVTVIIQKVNSPKALSRFFSLDSTEVIDYR